MRRQMKHFVSAAGVLAGSIVVTAATPDDASCLINHSIPELAIPCGVTINYYSDPGLTIMVGQEGRYPAPEVSDCNCEYFIWGQRTGNNINTPTECAPL